MTIKFIAILAGLIAFERFRHKDKDSYHLAKYGMKCALGLMLCFWIAGHFGSNPTAGTPGGLGERTSEPSSTAAVTAKQELQAAQWSQYFVSAEGNRCYLDSQTIN
jgi:hypothetical protein